jgi:hypothetical protein
MGDWNTQTRVFACLAALLIAVAFGDAVVSKHGLTEIPRKCLGPNPCEVEPSPFDQRSAELDDLDTREQLWWLLAAAAIAGAVVSAMPTGDEKLRGYVASVGTAGVLSGVVMFVAIWLATVAGLEGSGGWFLYPSYALIGLAGLGALHVRSRRSAASPLSADLGPASGGPSSVAAISGRLPLIALLLVFAASIASLLWAGGQPDCGSLPTEGYSHTWEVPAQALTLIAMGFGLLTLLFRRWLIALCCLAIPGIVYFFAAVASLCG